MLACDSCGRTYEPGPDEPWRCVCGHALDFAAAPSLPADPPSVDLDRGVGAFEALLPVAHRVSFGEGGTPVVAADRWGARFALEYVSPSGSFKDRGATTLVSRAAALGVDRVLEDSSGNAGLAVAQYAARAGIPARIYVPADAAAGKRRGIEATGAEVVPVDGDRQAVTDACVAAVEAGDGWYASHAWNPAFYAGTATFAYELAARDGWSAPDALVVPIGHGTLFLGVARGFRRLHDAGWIDRVPRLLGVQAAGCAPVAAALGADASGANALAAGVQVALPARFDQVLAAVEATDGDVIAADEASTEATRDALWRAGYPVAATSALAVAGLERYRERGDLAPDADVVVPLTGRTR